MLLGQMLMGDHNVGVREQAVSSLYQQNTLAAHTFIEAALKDKDQGVKKLPERYCNNGIRDLITIRLNNRYTHRHHFSQVMNSNVFNTRACLFTRLRIILL